MAGSSLNSLHASSSTLPDASRIVQDLPFRWNVQGKIFIIGGLGFMFDAWDVTLNGILAPLVLKEWSLSASQISWIGLSNLIGMGLGAFLWGHIADRIGRKKAFCYTLLMFAVFTVLGIFSQDIAVFCLFRFLAGVGLGGCIPVDYALVGELSPARSRGKILTAMDGWWPIGAGLCGVVSAWLVSMIPDWRLLLLVMVLPALLVIWVRSSVPESPLFLAQTGQEERARKVIDDLVERTEAPPRPYIVHTSESGTLHASPIAGLSALWRRHPRKTATAWLLFSTILLAYYICLLWMPKLLIGAGFAEVKAFLTTAGMALAGILGVLVSAALVERVGRRMLLTLSTPLALLSLIVASMRLGDPGWVTVWLLLYGVFIQIAIPVLYTYVSEMYPTSLRASGFGWASAASRVVAGVGPLLFVSWIWPQFGVSGGFWILLALCSAALILMFFLVPETARKNLD